jgi:hypothetical protein
MPHRQPQCTPVSRLSARQQIATKCAPDQPFVYDLSTNWPACPSKGWPSPEHPAAHVTTTGIANSAAAHTSKPSQKSAEEVRRW